MKYRLISIVLTTAVLSLGSTLSLAVDNMAATTSQESASKAGANQKNAVKAANEQAAAKAAKRKAAAKIKLVDINSANKAELKKLPGIGDAEADKIIAGRPYLTKSHLVTNQVIPMGVFEGLRNQVIAKQNEATAKKLEEMQKQAEKKKH